METRRHDDEQAPDETRTIDGWRGRTLALSLDGDDLDLVDHALCLVPELRVVVRLGQEARRRAVEYPITSPRSLIGYLNGDSFELDGHRIDAPSIRHAMAEDWFPLTHEGELLSAIHLAIRRCQAELAAAVLDRMRDLPVHRRPEPFEQG